MHYLPQLKCRVHQGRLWERDSCPCATATVSTTARLIAVRSGSDPTMRPYLARVSAEMALNAQFITILLHRSASMASGRRSGSGCS